MTRSRTGSIQRVSYKDDASCKYSAAEDTMILAVVMDFYGNTEVEKSRTWNWFRISTECDRRRIALGIPMRTVHQLKKRWQTTVRKMFIEARDADRVQQENARMEREIFGEELV